MERVIDNNFTHLTRGTELLAPAGDFSSAIYAFMAGADAVYLGLKEFSARKSARNFTFEALRRLKQYAIENNKRIYITINTIIRDEELGVLSHLLFDLESIIVDAVIIQDIGVYELIKEKFPSLQCHASTQMAVHNELGLKVLQELGIKRVVVPREMPLARMKDLCQKFPDMEIEAFVHGALCYSYSGLCLASAQMTGRSGNRGECAQVCRSDFIREQEKDYCFSCNDLLLADDILKLKAAGVHSFKIEGRMKAPEYVYNVVKLYRYILDHEQEFLLGKSNSPEYQDLIEKARLPFARKSSKGYLHSRSGVNLIRADFPGHEGLSLGTVQSIGRGYFNLKLEREISMFDGLMFIAHEPVRFSLRKLKKDGRESRWAKAGEEVEIFSEVLPQVGQEIFLISSRSQDLKVQEETRFSPFRKSISVKATIEKNHLVFVVALRGQELNLQYPIEVEVSTSGKSMQVILQDLLEEFGGGLFKAQVLYFGPEQVFIRPSILKTIKRDLVASFHEFYAQLRTECCQISTFAFDCLQPNFLSEQRQALAVDGLPLLFLSSNEVRGDIVALPPVIDEVELWRNKIEQLQKEKPNLCLGINNLGHLPLIDQVKYCFLDFYTYIANRYSLNFYYKYLGDKLKSGYYWVEDQGEKPELLPLVEIIDKKSLPLFFSHGCYHKQNISNGKCPAPCPKQYRYELKHNRRRYEVIIKDCVTMLFIGDSHSHTIQHEIKPLK